MRTATTTNRETVKALVQAKKYYDAAYNYADAFSETNLPQPAKKALLDHILKARASYRDDTYPYGTSKRGTYNQQTWKELQDRTVTEKHNLKNRAHVATCSDCQGWVQWNAEHTQAELAIEQVDSIGQHLYNSIVFLFNEDGTLKLENCAQVASNRASTPLAGLQTAVTGFDDLYKKPTIMPDQVAKFHRETLDSLCNWLFWTAAIGVTIWLVFTPAFFPAWDTPWGPSILIFPNVMQGWTCVELTLGMMALELIIAGIVWQVENYRGYDGRPDYLTHPKKVADELVSVSQVEGTFFGSQVVKKKSDAPTNDIPYVASAVDATTAASPSNTSYYPVMPQPQYQYNDAAATPAAPAAPGGPRRG